MVLARNALLHLRAPGKLYLFGEYAVLSGLPALLMAVPPYGSYRGPFSPQTYISLYPGAFLPEPFPPEPWGIVDTRSFFQGRRKRGLGSSSVAAVLKAGVELWGNWRTADLFQRALEIHYREVGPTSGADLLTIIHGGVGISYPHSARYHPLPLPTGLRIVVVEEENSANSRIWISRYRDAEKSASVRSWLKRVETWFSEAERKGVGLELLAGACSLYEELGPLLGEDLYPPRFRFCQEIARTFSLCFKPSGAGGGDLGIFFLPERQCSTLLRVLKEKGIEGREVLPVSPGLTGWVYPGEGYDS